MYTNFPLYPTSIFSNTDYPAQADNTDTVYAALINALKTAMQACFDELGTLPKGFHVSVKARIEALEAQLKIIIDDMEYADDAAAQAAYVSDDAVAATDFITGGTSSADSEYGGNNASNGCDNNDSTRWSSDNSAYPHWWKYDLSSGVTKTARKMRLKNFTDGNNVGVKGFTLQGSNNNTDWTDIYTGEHGNNINYEEYSFSNATAYRYYKLQCNSSWSTVFNFSSFYEIELMEDSYNLQSYEEGIIVKKGDHSLKVVAKITASLSDTLTKTFSTVLDLTGKTLITLWAKSDRTGSNFKVGYHDSGGETIEFNINILVVDTWEEKIIDISGVDDADKNAIEQIKYTVLNADSTTIIYLDDNYSV